MVMVGFLKDGCTSAWLNCCLVGRTAGGCAGCLECWLVSAMHLACGFGSRNAFATDKGLVAMNKSKEKHAFLKNSSVQFFLAR